MHLLLITMLPVPFYYGLHNVFFLLSLLNFIFSNFIFYVMFIVFFCFFVCVSVMYNKKMVLVICNFF